jgi:hypothetical protein
VNTDIGKPPELAWLPVGKLSVDPKYQRDTGSRRSQSLIEKIKNDFRWSRFGVVLAVKHKGGWFVIDGQHRVEAAKARGDIETVPAVVLPHATVEAAAVDFVAINRDRVAVTPLHIHHAQLSAGDPQAMAIARVCAASGLEVCRYPIPSTHMKPRQTLAVATIGRLITIRDEAFATAVLKRVVAAVGTVPGACNAGAIRCAAEELGLDGGSPTRPTQLGQAKTRDCLGCGRPFRSDGAHNRMCDPCKAAA